MPERLLEGRAEIAHHPLVAAEAPGRLSVAITFSICVGDDRVQRETHPVKERTALVGDGLDRSVCLDEGEAYTPDRFVRDKVKLMHRSAIANSDRCATKNQHEEKQSRGCLFDERVRVQLLGPFPECRVRKVAGNM